MTAPHQAIPTTYTPPPADTPIPVITLTEQQRAAARRAIEAREQFEFVTGQLSFGIDDEDDDENWQPPF